MSAWVRLWTEMPNDPKWRVIARRSGRPVSEVMAVFVHMMTNAGRAKERGTLEAWCDEDVAISIDAESEHVAAIREAMQGKTLDGESLSGWAKRQPAREDGSADRARAWRERTRTHDAHGERERTHPTADERPDIEVEAEVEVNTPPSLRSGSSPAAAVAGPPAKQPAPKRRQPEDGELVDRIGSLWNVEARALGLPTINGFSDRRLAALRARIREASAHGFQDPFVGFQAAMANIRSSPFLLGQGQRGWKVDFDYLVSPQGFAKILEGGYAKAG